MLWLLVAKRPVASLRPFRDRNFAAGSVVVLVMFSVLYASAVLFTVTAAASFCMVPFVFLFKGGKKRGGGAPAH